jgi:hypothetical protein
MLYRSFQFYLDFANGDIELASKIEMLVMKSVKDFADDLAKRIESGAKNEGEIMVSLGLNRAALISAQHRVERMGDNAVNI